MTAPPWLLRAKRLYEDGASLSEVAQKLNLANAQTVRRALLAAGVTIRSRAAGRARHNGEVSLANRIAGPRSQTTRSRDMGKL